MDGRIKDGLNAILKLMSNPVNANNTANAYNINNFMKSVGTAVKNISAGKSVISSIASITVSKWIIKSWDNIYSAIKDIKESDGTTETYTEDQAFASIVIDPLTATISSNIEDINNIVQNSADIVDEDSTMIGDIQIDQSYDSSMINQPVLYNGKIISTLQMAMLMWQVENGYIDNISADNIKLINSKILEAKSFINKFGKNSYLIAESQLVERG